VSPKVQDLLFYLLLLYSIVSDHIVISRVPAKACSLETFEGLSLGTRIALLRFEPDGVSRKWYIPSPPARPYIMSSLYGMTTPLGQAIGLILLYSPNTSYDPASATALVLVGVMNAISAGLLLWASLVELLAADFLGSGRRSGLMGQSVRYRIYASLSVLGGAASMALVGAWA
jgi:zinc transporter 1/2/3